MADITFTGSLLVSKVPPLSSPDGMNIANAIFALSSGIYIKDLVLVPITTAIAVPLGQVTTPGFAVFYNADPTNYIQLLLTSTTGVFKRILPGRMVFDTLDPGMTPFMLANVAPCLMQYMILNGG